MSDVLKLKDCIVEYRKANKKLDDKLTQIEEQIQQKRREQAEQQSR